MSLELLPDQVRWQLPAEFNIYQATLLKGELETALAHGLPLTCVLDEVEEIDCSGLQLLLLARRETQARSLALRMEGATASCIDACQVMGLTALLETDA